MARVEPIEKSSSYFEHKKNTFMYYATIKRTKEGKSFKEILENIQRKHTRI